MRAVVREAWGENAGPKTLSLVKGLPVDVLEVNQDWSYVSFNGQRGFVPTAVLATPEGDTLKPQAAQEGAAVPSLGLLATVVLDYEAEVAEGLSCPANAQLRVVQAGEEWTFCEYKGRKGFVPTALLRVSAESLLEHCRRTGVEVVPANYGTSDSSAGSEADRAGAARATTTTTAATTGTTTTQSPGSPRAGVQPPAEPMQKDASLAIPPRVWQGLSDAEKHRQQMLYGIVHAEFVFNKNMWALSQISRDFAGLNAAHPMLTADERDALFQDVDALYALSNTVFGQLVRRVKSCENGVVDSIADIIESNLPAFDAYVRYCNKERRSVQQQVFLEYRSLFGHPFHKFLEKLGQQADLQLLVGKPAQHVALWPFFVKNLLKDTSKTRASLEYRTLRSLQAAFADLNGQLQRSSAAVAADLQRRIVNYAKLEPHVRGRRLLKESPAKIVSGSGGDLGNQAFLFDTCIVFARSQGDSEGEAFRALKKVKLSGLRIADVQKATIVLRSEGDKYYLTFPSSTTAIDWRAVISHKTYRERMDYSDADSEDQAFALLPQLRPEYDAHLARVQRMQEFIGALLGPGMPAIKLTAAGPETLKQRGGASAHRAQEQPRAVAVTTTTATTRGAKGTTSPRKLEHSRQESEGHAYTDSEEEEAKKKKKSAAAAVSPRKAAPPKRLASEDRSASQILNDAMASTPAMGNTPVKPTRRSSRDQEEEGSSVLSTSESRPSRDASPLKPVAAPPRAAHTAAAPSPLKPVPIAHSDEDEEEMEDDSEFTDASSSGGGGTGSRAIQTPPMPVPTSTPAAVATPAASSPAKAGTPVQAVAATPDLEEDSSDFVSSSSEKRPKSSGRAGALAAAPGAPAGTASGSSMKEPMMSAAYRTLTGQLDNIIAKSTAGTRSASPAGGGSDDEDEEEFESEYSSEQPKTGAAATAAAAAATAGARPTATPVARPTAAMFSHSPEESGNASANTSGKATARSGGTKSKGDDEEESWEEEEFSVSTTD